MNAKYRMRYEYISPLKTNNKKLNYISHLFGDLEFVKTLNTNNSFSASLSYLTLGESLMPLHNTSTDYGTIAKWFHWGTALLFLAAYCSVY